MKKPKVLVLEKDDSLQRSLTDRLNSFEINVLAFANKQDALRAFKDEAPDVAVLGSARDGTSHGLDLTKLIRGFSSTIPIILLARRSSEETAIEAIKTGVQDYFKEPFPSEEISKSILRCLSISSSWLAPVARRFQCPEGFLSRIVGISSAISGIKSSLKRIAAADSTILITGETGTGKELVAELIHDLTGRTSRPFVRFNCAAVPDTLVESELFGHDKGAFTGAELEREGALRRADGGTVLLDEVGDMSLLAQAKILRFIENKEIQRLGRSGSTLLDVRIIAATNQELEDLVTQRRFRKDLYYRLNVVRIHVPPLRERREDIPCLLNHFVEVFNLKMGTVVKGFREDSLQQMMRHGWPGNVRELKNVVEAVFVNTAEDWISSSCLPESIRGATDGSIASEPAIIVDTLRTTRWNKSKAAKKLHCSRMTLYRKMAKYGIKKREGLPPILPLSVQ